VPSSAARPWLPASALAPRPDATGFRWAAWARRNRERAELG